ncbi:bifunctional uroporphyrinogen-III synthetase/response regulator domain protein [Pseudomonas saudimassiliensis]|uniref:Bifunctional uroporphyrinogen-III synthetase/response regulator domain protein n=1 Tax=Pseudomonas saudimassiliensis TaxID=1461581 RepID=A0A078MHP2_9PSED|nr:uroporphyrinogen-III synthase [Pseudomonas saudimassiliensis]CEA05784.1 bifunctional uroporphyrinogen-III synthetase/response regulator domain protein [Pseudomonas saudimassiliensis]CEF27321.1 bifunctional uroporphyrinogen-III synthetase/response regulator domain protein [Pseudomonas saudimassiliensis]
MSDLPLAGRRIALPESRELDLFADMLLKRGAEVVRCPLVAIHDAPDQQPVRDWLHTFNSEAWDDFIMLTGEGMRRLLTAAERAGGSMREDFIHRLGQVRKIVRGPKPGAALRAVGLKAEVVAVEPTTAGIIATLQNEDLRGRKIAVQLYGTDPNQPLMDFLAQAGAQVAPVWPYIYADDAENARVDQLIAEMASGRLDAIAFTSGTQVRRLFQIGKRTVGESRLREILGALRIAAVGPVVASELEERGLRVDLMPPSSFFMKPLVRELVREFGGASPDDGLH